MPMLSINLMSGKSRIEFELDEHEYYAMGRVTAQWAYLEHGIYTVTYGISKAVGIEIPRDALSASFKRRLRALRLLVEECAPDGERERMLKLLDQVANAEQDRHKVTHALWDWDRANPERINASSFRPGFEFEKNFDAKKMNELADRIGQISFELEYPDGWEAAIAERFQESTDAGGDVAYAHISRQLSRALSSRKAQAQPESDQATPRSGTPPQSSSEE